MKTASRHIVLLGDSVFDNGSYTRGEPDVAAHLLSLLQPDARVTLLARDGATVAGLERQLAGLPADASPSSYRPDATMPWRIVTCSICRCGRRARL